MNGVQHKPRSRRTLLGVWAHPDDEAYLSAGLMAAWRRRGDRVVLVTATRGERGTDDPDRWPPRRLARLRERELRGSLAVLGVRELRILGYPDGFCDAHNGTSAIAAQIADVQPDVIVTFGPDGMTGHQDHRAVSRWVTEAWQQQDTAAALWYATISEENHRRWALVNDRVGLWDNQPHPPMAAVDDLAHHVTLSNDLLDLKMSALQAHASQTAGLRDLLGEAAYRGWWRTESFRAADAPDRRGLPDLVATVRQ